MVNLYGLPPSAANVRAPGDRSFTWKLAPTNTVLVTVSSPPYSRISSSIELAGLCYRTLWVASPSLFALMSTSGQQIFIRAVDQSAIFGSHQNVLDPGRTPASSGHTYRHPREHRLDFYLLWSSILLLRLVLNNVDAKP
ncbi:hypothetical protein PTI98_003707 [Pleurotus ostreatus]|nr:hypothetical protein PTI98_003707 [Pleurotus ostreatus]